MPNERSIGGDVSAADAGGEIVDALEGRRPGRGPTDQTADPDNVPPPR
ncbi:MAG TPA: hypothetical protein VFZ21_23365 [Gemmatimonadaceae bacterium]|nr:hypothetical protein [Gemmatimonadaceae bacterium]